MCVPLDHDKVGLRIIFENELIKVENINLKNKNSHVNLILNHFE